MRLIGRHGLFDVMELTRLYPLLRIIPSRVENETMAVQMRVGQIALDRPRRLVDEMPPEQFPRFAVVVNAALADACHGIGFNQPHGFRDAIPKGIQDMVVLGEGVEDGNGLWAVKVYVVPRPAVLPVQGGKTAPCYRVAVFAEGEKSFLRGRPLKSDTGSKPPFPKTRQFLVTGVVIGF